MSLPTIQARRTKTGQYIHACYPGSNQAFCGVRSLTQVRGKIAATRFCEKCYGQNVMAFTEGRIEAVEIV